MLTELYKLFGLVWMKQVFICGACIRDRYNMDLLVFGHDKICMYCGEKKPCKVVKI